MPTGYTAKILEGCTFEEYALACARAFGALVMMRDDPMDAEIPQEFKPSDYNQKRLAEAQEELNRLQGMNTSQAMQARDEDFAKEFDYYKKHVEKNDAERKLYLAMLAKAKAYKSPTPDHDGYAKFLITQIEESIEFDCPAKSYLQPPVKLAVDLWLKKQIDAANHDVEYHTKGHAEEVDRCEKRTAWVKSLRESLGI